MSTVAAEHFRHWCDGCIFTCTLCLLAHVRVWLQSVSIWTRLSVSEYSAVHICQISDQSPFLSVCLCVCVCVFLAQDVWHRRGSVHVPNPGGGDDLPASPLGHHGHRPATREDDGGDGEELTGTAMHCCRAHRILHSSCLVTPIHTQWIWPPPPPPPHHHRYSLFMQACLGLDERWPSGDDLGTYPNAAYELNCRWWHQTHCLHLWLHIYIYINPKWQTCYWSWKPPYDAPIRPPRRTDKKWMTLRVVSVSDPLRRDANQVHLPAAQRLLAAHHASEQRGRSLQFPRYRHGASNYHARRCYTKAPATYGSLPLTWWGGGRLQRLSYLFSYQQYFHLTTNWLIM